MSFQIILIHFEYKRVPCNRKFGNKFFFYRYHLKGYAGVLNGWFFFTIFLPLLFYIVLTHIQEYSDIFWHIQEFFRHIQGLFRHILNPQACSKPCAILAYSEPETYSMHKKWSFPLMISSVNVTKSARNCGFGHIYWRNS